MSQKQHYQKYLSNPVEKRQSLTQYDKLRDRGARQSSYTLRIQLQCGASRLYDKPSCAEQQMAHSRATSQELYTVTINELSVEEAAELTVPRSANTPALKAAKPKLDNKPVQSEPVVEVEGITLFSLRNNLQTSLLANLISEHTKLPCVIETQYTPHLTHTTLALVDCQGHSVEELQDLIRNIQNHKLQNSDDEIRTVLLNATAESEHEELLDWPCIVGVLFDDTDQEQLTRGLDCLLNGEYWVPRRLLHLFLQKNRRAPNAQRLDIKLTKRERQILKLIKDGATNSDIATALEVSEHTVKSHLYNVYKKIGVRNRLEANNWVRDMDSL